LLARAKTDQSGAFQTGVLNPGSYTLTAWVQGFRARAWSAVIVRSGEVTDLGTIPLDIAGCDAPGVNCDSIDPSPPRNPIVASGYLTVRLNCGADLAKSSVYCLDDATSRRQERTADLRATRSDAGIYLAPVNGTAMSALNPSRQDCSGGNQKPDRIRLDGLGPGNDLCVRTRDGRMSHVFLVNDVEPDSLEIQLWYVTRKR
jgi:hypothetical protein